MRLTRSPARGARAASSSSAAWRRDAVGALGPAEHARQLLDAVGARQRPTSARVRPDVDPLAHAVVPVGVGRDLRQVRDAQHLLRASERGEPRAQRVGHRSADAGVDLVEDQHPAIPGGLAAPRAGRA